jgi:two-component system, NarL family, sensor histidine kinase UhpB
MSLRFRLNLLVTMLSLAFMVLVGWVLVNDTRNSIREQVEAATRVTIQLLDTVIVSSAMNPSLGPTHYVLQEFLQSLGYVRSCHIELYDHAGNTLYVSPESSYLKEVNPPNWFINLVSPKPETVQRRIRYGTLSVTSSSHGTVREAWAGFRQLILIGLGFFVLLNLMVYALLSHALRPVKHILDGIKRVEQGDLSTQLPTFELPEFNKIGLSLNRMMHSLDAERQLKENRQLTQLIQKHIEDERRSLARELHDELGQYVTAVKTFAVAIANKTKEKAPDIEANAQTIVAAANQIYDGMHNIVRQLRPSAMDNMGLAETLKDMISGYQNQHKDMQIKLAIHGEFNQLGENVNINIYRIVQESVNNTIKHAKAQKVLVSLQTLSDDVLQLSIEDDGIGMDLQKVDQANHFGLLGIKERVQALNGQFVLQSNVNKTANNAMIGTKISITIPKSTQ